PKRIFKDIYFKKYIILHPNSLDDVDRRIPNEPENAKKNSPVNQKYQIATNEDMLTGNNKRSQPITTTASYLIVDPGNNQSYKPKSLPSTENVRKSGYLHA
ncbi:hypothetical protein Tcan_01009, partial [Toxocara canis]